MHNSSRHVHVLTDMQGYAATMLSVIMLMAYNNPAAIGAAAWSGQVARCCMEWSSPSFLPSGPIYISTDSAAVA